MAELDSDRDGDGDGDSRTTTFRTPLPRALDAQLHVRLTTRAKCVMLFVTTAGADDGESALGSFVYAVPDRFNEQPLCTHLYVDEESLEFAARLARLLVKRTQRPAYVASSVRLGLLGLGGTVEEVLEVLQAVATPLLPLLPGPGSTEPNGV